MKKAFLEITMKVSGADRPKAGAVYSNCKPPFLVAAPEIRIYECQ